MTTMQQVADGQTYPEVPINENFDAVSAFALFAKRHAATSGLTWAYYGGYYDSTLVADGTVTLTNAAANYVVVERATGVVSVSTATTNWNDTGDYGRLYKVTTAGGVVTAIEDHRFGASGILTSSGGSAPTAAEITIADSNSSFAGSTVEEALEELGGAVAGSVTSVNGLTGAVTLTAKNITIIDSDSQYAGQSIEEALEEIGASIDSLAAPTAAQVTIADSDSKYAGASVEEALEEIGAKTEAIVLACSDETTALTTGTAKVTFRMPYAMTLTAVRASVTTAPTGATLLTVDINESGSTILSTKLTFDASEKTTTTATTPAVISDAALADDAEMTIDIDAVGSTIAGAGLKVYLIGRRA